MSENCLYLSHLSDGKDYQVLGIRTFYDQLLFLTLAKLAAMYVLSRKGNVHHLVLHQVVNILFVCVSYCLLVL